MSSVVISFSCFSLWSLLINSLILSLASFPLASTNANLTLIKVSSKVLSKITIS